MSTTDNSGQEPEQHTPPIGEAGCETKIDRSVLGTVDTTGFAELRARAIAANHEASDAYLDAKRSGEFGAMKYAMGVVDMACKVVLWIDAIEADAKDEIR